MKKILIIQFRKEKKILEQEQEIIKKIFRKSSLDLYIINYFKVRSINVKQYDFIIIGGSSFSVTKKNQSINNLYILIRKIIKNNIPLLGICFGFQAIAVALGGKVTKDLEKKEYGTYKVSLTDKGKEDRIFSGFPKNFFAQQGHEDFVIKMPKKAVLLAVNESGYIESARFGSNTVGVQFHPEMNKNDMEKRYKLVTSNLDSFEKFQKNLQNSPAKKVILNFLSSNMCKNTDNRILIIVKVCVMLYSIVYKLNLGI